MPAYNRKRIARLFDEKINVNTCKGAGPDIPEVVRKRAFEQLELENKDVLLDVGTGTGDTAIAAAHICCQVIGIDISKNRLEKARQKALKENVENVIFAYGAFEELCAELDLASYSITKILAVYSLHHLPDPLKKKSLYMMADLLHKPGRIVIGDIMFFEDPEEYRETFDDVYYDDGNTDFPSSVEYLTECLEQIGAHIYIEKNHPLVGVIRADFF